VLVEPDDELVADYRWATVKRYGTGYVAYSVLADLIRAGWRLSARERATE
jgi:hypothetical protein